MIILAFWITFVIMSVIIAERKNRSGVAHFFGAAIFGIFWLLIVLCLPCIEKEEEKEEGTEKKSFFKMRHDV